MTWGHRWRPRVLGMLALVLATWLIMAPLASAQQRVSYGSERDQWAELYAAADGAPVLVLVTGGGWIRNEPAIARPFATSLQAAGVTVLVPYYTLGAPETAVADVAQAAAYAAALPGHGRLTLGGHSAGAQLAALVGLDGRAPVDGLLLLSGIYDLPATVRDGGIASWLVQQAFDSDVARWQADSPLAHVRAGAPPTWIVHGAADTDVRPERAQAFAASLRAAGSDVTLSLLAGVGHLDTPLALLRQEREPLLRFLARGPADAAP